MVKKTLDAIREQVKKEPMAQKMGLVLEEVSPGQSQVRLQTDNGFTNILGGIHGTAVFALIDEAFQVASNSHGSVAVALNMNLTFHNAPEIGETLTAKAQEVHAGRRTATYLISVTTASGRLIATCQALAYRKRDRLPFLEGQ
jgi:acyl-CoA thioesterase